MTDLMDGPMREASYFGLKKEITEGRRAERPSTTAPFNTSRMGSATDEYRRLHATQFGRKNLISRDCND